jgi:MSHA biogenesis protein MshJ
VREYFERYAARFDAMPQRERALLLAAALLAFGFLFFLLGLEPKLAQKKRLTQQVAELRAGAATLEQQLKAQHATDPRNARRAERDSLRKQLADIDRSMGQVQRGLVPPERAALLLEEMLRSGGGLQLVSVRTLPVQRFNPAGSGADASNDAERQLYQHGFEITVHGSYAELHEYLAKIERLPWRLYWSRISVTSHAEPQPKLSVTLTVQTISLSKAWLVV